MRQRTTNPRSHNWKHYGGRGIKCCERWEKFENFLADMGRKPSGTSLGRIDNDGPYAPENCRWEKIHQQANNRRPGGKRVGYYSELSNQVGLPYHVLYLRVRAGWTLEDALSTPKAPRTRRTTPTPTP